jgi:hypothetical protein
VAILFPDAPMPAVSALQAPWMLQALLTMRGDRALAAEARRSSTNTEAPGAQSHDRADADPRSWTAVALDAHGRPAIALAAAGQELVVRVGAAPSSYLAALALRSLLDAVSVDPAWIEHETVRIAPAILRDWSREPGPIPDWRWRQGAPGDARWFWALVLALLAVEMVVRRTVGTRESRDEGARAA